MNMRVVVEMKNVYNKYINDKTNCDIITKISIISLIIVISGVFGFVYEFIFYYFNGGMETFYYRGSNFLPWINIYAIGSLLIYFITSKYKKNKLKVFILSTLICGILEYIAGYILFTYF